MSLTSRLLGLIVFIAYALMAVGGQLAHRLYHHLHDVKHHHSLYCLGESLLVDIETARASAPPLSLTSGATTAEESCIFSEALIHFAQNLLWTLPLLAALLYFWPTKISYLQARQSYFAEIFLRIPRARGPPVAI